MSIGSTLSEEIESMNDKLNFIKFDEVVQHLRYVLVINIVENIVVSLNINVYL